MMYVKVTSGVPEIYTIGQLRKDNPNTSFPRSIPASTLAEFGVFPVENTAVPEYDKLTHKVDLGVPELVEGVWKKTWVLEPLTAEEASEAIAAKEVALRQKRDNALRDTDWIVLRALELGEPIPADIAAYRQSLRDVPQQTNFPDVDLPTRPKV